MSFSSRFFSKCLSLQKNCERSVDKTTVSNQSSLNYLHCYQFLTRIWLFFSNSDFLNTFSENNDTILTSVFFPVSTYQQKLRSHKLVLLLKQPKKVVQLPKAFSVFPNYRISWYCVFRNCSVTHIIKFQSVFQPLQIYYTFSLNLIILFRTLHLKNLLSLQVFLSIISILVPFNYLFFKLLFKLAVFLLNNITP